MKTGLKKKIAFCMSFVTVLCVCILLGAAITPTYAETGHASMASDVHSDHGHTASESHGDGHESEAGLPQLDVSTFPSQIFWLGITFFILYIYFSNKALPEISGVIENRNDHITGDLETAESMKEEAESVREAYEKSLESARLEATKTMAEMQQKMKEKAAASQQEFRAKMDKEIEALNKRLDKAKLDAMDDMNTIAAEIASDAAKKIVGISTDVKQAKSFVESISGKNRKSAKAA